MRLSLVAAVLVMLGAVSAAEAPRIDPPLEAGPLREGPPVGFVTHPHMGDHQGNLRALADTPATAELTNVFGWRMKREPRPGEEVSLSDLEVDFAIPEAWLREVYRSGRSAYPILDTGIHHSEVPWRRELTERVGHNVVGYDGVTRHWSSFHSPVYRGSVFHYIDQLIDWVKRNDGDRRIPGYINGAEWFWPYGTHDFSPLAVDAFRAWLQAKYGEVDALNAAWGAAFPAFDAVEPVRPFGAGEFGTGYGTYSLGAPAVYTFSSPPFPVEPGDDLRISVTYRAEGAAEGLADVVALWVDALGKPIHVTSWAANDESDAGPFEAITRVPRALLERPVAPAAMRLLLRLSGAGRVVYTEPRVTRHLDGRELLSPGREADWSFDGSGEARGRHDAATGALVIEGALPDPPYGRSGIAHEDWIAFTYESMADWLDRCAQHIKERDPSRLVASYVGWVFAMQAQWAPALQEQRLDISLANTPNIDVNGIQMCIAGDDYTYATFLIDLARKYGKPIWVTDLIDFPYGLFSGFDPIYRGSLASVQHGLDGFFYYNWWGTRDYAYSDHLTGGELDRMLADSRAAIEWLEGAQPLTDAAVISPILPFSLLDAGGRKGDPYDAGGLYRLVLDLGLTPDVWTPYEIARTGPGALDAYRVVFLSDCPALPAEVNAALSAYIRGGGILALSGRPPTLDMAGEPLLERLWDLPADEGTAALGKGAVVRLGDRVGKRYWGKTRQVAEYGNTPPLPVEVPDPQRTPEARRAARVRAWEALQSAGAAIPIEIELLTGDVHASLHRTQDGGHLLFLVHKGRGRLYDLPLRIRLAGGAGPWAVWADFDKTHTVTPDDEGRAVIPAFSHCALVRIQAEGLQD